MTKVFTVLFDRARKPKLNENIVMKTIALAPIEVEILLIFSLKSKRLKRIAGLAPKNDHAKYF
ncbi:hypothetical protein BXU01_20205 [[Flexibacter] sp. ATCC 35103]|nr:hypothetical protein BXU01_20205 [[Flexibacter] sp. ATCC 35103]